MEWEWTDPYLINKYNKQIKQTENESEIKSSSLLLFDFYYASAYLLFANNKYSHTHTHTHTDCGEIDGWH